MKTVITIFLLITVLLSCGGIKKTIRESYRYEMYIDYRNISYQGSNGLQSIYFEIDSTNGMWYYGKLIVNQEDTFPVSGFEKGSHYVTKYQLPKTSDYGLLEIWCRGEMGAIRDSLTMEDYNKTEGVIKEKTTLYRKPRQNCN